MKKFLKKLVVCFAAGALVFCLAACGKSGEDESSQGSGQDGSLATSDSSQGQDVSEQEPDGSNVEGEDTDASGEDFGGSQPDQGWSEEMTALKDAVVDELGENYWPDMALDPEMLEMSFGISSEMYDDYMAEMPMISNHVDMLLIIKAKEDQADAVEEALNTYRENRVNNLSEYPMNVGKVQASRIERIGNYVLFVQLGADTTEAMDEGDDEAVISYCLEVNDLVIEVISKKLEH